MVHRRRRLAMVVVAGVLTVALPPTTARADDLDDARKDAARAAAALSDAESEVSRTQSRLADLRVEQDQANAQITTLRAAVQEAVIAQFVHQDAAMAAGATGNVNEQVIVDTLTDVATGTNQALIDRYARALEAADAAAEALQAEQARSTKAVEALTRRRDQANAKVSQLAALSQARAPRSSRPEASATPIAAGAWVCPVQGPVTFTNSWGAPRSGGRSHTGVDMLSPRGTPTVAPVAGRVVHKSSGLGGLTWYVYGDDGNTYYGAHLAEYANEGIGRVQAGTVIGYVGDSGNAKGTNHLHFQIKPGGGAAVNPFPTVDRYC